MPGDSKTGAETTEHLHLLPKVTHRGTEKENTKSLHLLPKKGGPNTLKSGALCSREERSKERPSQEEPKSEDLCNREEQNEKWPSREEKQSGRPGREGERTGGQKRGALGVEAGNNRSRTISTEIELSGTPWPRVSKVARREENNVNKGGGAEATQVGLKSGTTPTKLQKTHMASSKNSNRKSMGAESGNLAPPSIVKTFRGG